VRGTRVLVRLRSSREGPVYWNAAHKFGWTNFPHSEKTAIAGVLKCMANREFIY
jgi:hypothetical protein